MKRFTRDEAVLVAAAKEIQDGDLVFVGQGIGIVATVLAKVHHKKDILLLTEAGIVDFTPYRAPLHVADPTCTRGYAYECDMVDVFSTIAAPGYADICFLGVAQVDKYGNVNSTVIGDYHHPRIRLGGSGGAPELLAHVRKTILTMRGGRFVEKLDYVTSPGYLDGGDSRARLGLPPDCGPHMLVSTKGIFRFHPDTKEMYLDAVFPYSSVEDVKKDVPWDLKVAPQLSTIELPTEDEIDFIRHFDPTVSVGRRTAFDMFAIAMKNFLGGRQRPAAAPAAAAKSKVAEWFEALPSRFDPAQGAALAATYCFKISGEGGGDWTVVVTAQQCTVEPKAPDQADLTLAMAAEDWLAMVSGQLDPMVAFTAGKLTLQGNVTLAMKLSALLK